MLFLLYVGAVISVGKLFDEVIVVMYRKRISHLLATLVYCEWVAASHSSSYWVGGNDAM